MGERPVAWGSKHTVWIIGDTVLVKGVAECLTEARYPNLVYCEVAAPVLESIRKAEAQGTIIFELETPDSSILLDCLKNSTEINLVGLDRNCKRVSVWRSFQKTVLTSTDLLSLVNQIGSHGE